MFAIDIFCKFDPVTFLLCFFPALIQNSFDHALAGVDMTGKLCGGRIDFFQGIFYLHKRCDAIGVPWIIFSIQVIFQFAGRFFYAHFNVLIMIVYQNIKQVRRLAQDLAGPFIVQGFAQKIIPVLHLDHLIINKLASNRTKDKADVEELQKIMQLKKKDKG